MGLFKQAEVAAAVKQIDWASQGGGQGFVSSFQMNDIELLDAPVYPSTAYGDSNYPHCDDMFNVFPPYGNGVIGADGRKSIVDVVTKDVIPMDLVFKWDGAHDTRPVCSMSGVSYAGYAEINVYIQTQENNGTHVRRLVLVAYG